MIDLHNIKTSKIKADAIAEAVRLLDGITDYTIYAKRLEENKWQEAGYGSAKRSFKKNTILVKFPGLYSAAKYSETEIKREYEQWVGAPSKFRKYLTRTYGMIGLVLIQDLVILGRCGSIDCNGTWLINEFPIADFYGNHGHTKKGNVKIFDWVYRRAQLAHLQEDDTLNREKIYG